MLCPNVFCGLVTLLELAWGGTPDAAVLVFAMSRSACRILDVSGAVVAGGFPGCSLTEMKSFGGVPSGVVDFNATERKKNIRSLDYGNVLCFFFLQHDWN